MTWGSNIICEENIIYNLPFKELYICNHFLFNKLTFAINIYILQTNMKYFIKKLCFGQYHIFYFILLSMVTDCSITWLPKEKILACLGNWYRRFLTKIKKTRNHRLRSSQSPLIQRLLFTVVSSSLSLSTSSTIVVTRNLHPNQA